MRRRKFIAFLGGTVIAWPLAANAQQLARRIGILETIPPQANAANFDALRKGLRELGYDEGRSLIIEYRSADGRAERFPALAAELVRLNVDVIVTRGTPSALAARNATRTTPIVMASVGDVIGTGLAVSLARPGGNVTGLTAINTDTEGKRLELLKEMVPGLVRIAALYNMGNPTFALRWKEVELAARALGAESQLLDVRKAEDIAPAFAAATAQRAGALLTSVDALIQANQRTILELAAKHRLPAIYPTREFVENGGLMAYGVSYPDLYRRAATYIDKIFKGARPADLPIEQPTRFELVINLKAAKALGLTVPPTLLAGAAAAWPLARRGRSSRASCPQSGILARERPRRRANGLPLSRSGCINLAGSRAAPSRSSRAGWRDAAIAPARSRGNSRGSRSISSSPPELRKSSP